MNFLNFENKNYLISGISNKKSVAYHAANVIKNFCGKLLLSVQNESQLDFVKTKFPDALYFICDVSKDEDILNLKEGIRSSSLKVSGFLHSLAYARFTSPKIDEINFDEFSEALKISAFSLVDIVKNLKESFTQDASIVSVSISNLRATNYGYMGPIKSLLNSAADYLAKSFSSHSQIRFNTIAAGPLKTSASAGIPNYVENYLFCEKLSLRKSGLKTNEVANTIAFLLSSASSGINASTITVDAGMNVNYFDEEIIRSSSTI